MISFSPELMAPPLVLRPSARLPLKVELVMVAGELLLMAPPLPSPVPVEGPHRLVVGERTVGHRQ